MRAGSRTSDPRPTDAWRPVRREPPTGSRARVRHLGGRALILVLCAAIVPAGRSLAGQAPPAGDPHVPAGLATTADPRLLRAQDLYTGVAGTVDDAAARELLLEAAAIEGNVLSRMWIARVHSRGRMGFERDEARARSIAAELVDDLRGLAAAGDVEALFLMGTAYDEGLGVDVDHAEAMRWYRRAARHGHVLAVHNVGNMHRDGRGVPADAAAAVRWWLRAAHAGDVIPALRLGEAYESGRGVTRDLQEARRWYERAARAGNRDAAEALRRLVG